MVSGGLCPQYGKHVRLQYCTLLKTFLHRAHFVNIFQVTNVENLWKWTNILCATCDNTSANAFCVFPWCLTHYDKLGCNYCGKIFG